MSSLFSSLQTASTALNVYSRALGNEETNVANASTPGFAALRTTIHPIDSFGPPIGAVDYIDVQSSGSKQADALYRDASSQASASQTQTDQLTPVNQAFDITGTTGILGAFQKFNTAFANLSVTPNSPSLRSSAISAASDVAAAFRKAAVKVDSLGNSAESGIAGVVGQINGLAAQIRQYNVQIRSGASADSGASSGLRAALDQISSLTDTTTITNSDGTVSVLAGGQQPLVLGDQVFNLSYVPGNPAGKQIISSGGGGGPANYSGQLGALLNFRNNTVAGITGSATQQGSLNQLAQGFASRANTLLSSGTTAAGAAGTPLFTWNPAINTDVARSLDVDPAFTESQLATGNITSSNGTADALAKLIGSQNPADQIGGLSAQDFYSGIATGVGQQLATAREQSNIDQSALTSAQVSRQQSSGVSLDQEAVAITAYERAYQANAKVISVLSELTNDVVNLIK